MPTRPCGGRYAGRASRGGRGSHGSSRTATSGRAQVICCTSTPSGSCASPDPATPSPAIDTAPAPEKRSRVGYEWVHSLVDDHSWLGLQRAPPDERAATVTGFVERGLAFYAAHGITVERLISDNAFVYRKNRSLGELLERNGIRHLLIPIRRPQVNGKVERYQQTLKREWALGQTYRSSDHRAQALTHWLRHYNERRPHSSLGGRPPISRVQNVPRQDS